MANWGYGAATHGTPTAGTASGSVLAANGSRRYLLIQNISDTDVFLGFGTAAVVNKGVRVTAGSVEAASYEMTREKGNLFTGTIFAIHGGSGTKSLLVTEGQ